MGVWDFIGEDTDEYTHGLHLYPAKLNPHVARRLIEQYGSEASNVWDPFCGSGTTLVEGRIAGKNVYGNDINPTAIQISLAKTQDYDINDVEHLASSVIKVLDDPKLKLMSLKKAIKSSGFTEKQILEWKEELNKQIQTRDHSKKVFEEAVSNINVLQGGIQFGELLLKKNDSLVQQLSKEDSKKLSKQAPSN